MEYMKRIADERLSRSLKIFGAVLIEGPKYCGKTRTCQEHSKTQIYLQNPADKDRFDAIVAQDPRLLFRGEPPILLDEWQDYPRIWDAVRFDVDQREIKGGFLLTGSSSSRNVTTMHSGAGRIGRLMMRPMSVFESRYASPSVSLRELFATPTVEPARCVLTLDDYMEIVCRGGFPASRYLNHEDSLIATRDYVTELNRLRIAGAKSMRTASTVNARLLRSIARNLLTTYPFDKMHDEVVGNDSELSRRTIYNYYEKLKNYFIVDDVEAWNPHIRSRARTRKTPKRNFVDPAIAVGILNLDKEALLSDLRYYGFLFESLCIRDLRIFADELGGEVLYFGDNSGLDVDAIIQLKDGRWGAAQVKVGSGRIEEAANELDRMVAKLDLSFTQHPSFLMILTGTQDAYTRADGKVVVPLGLLMP